MNTTRSHRRIKRVRFVAQEDHREATGQRMDRRRCSSRQRDRWTRMLQSWVSDASHGGWRAEAGRLIRKPDSKGGKEGRGPNGYQAC